MVDHRNPDIMLEQLKQAEKANGRGRLKIFFGYAAGVGKTYSMLEAAHEAKRLGIDVVVGYIEPHQRPQTMALVKGLEEVAPIEIEYENIKLKELDVDAVIKRNPELVMVDELAHTNAKGSRHAKRYGDVEELLKAGINVYTTINVQHLESLNDIVESITGIAVRERIPDRIFDDANQVELIDIEPEELIDRLNQGKIYKNEQARRALENFFTKENLVALREIALRRTADQVNIAVERNKILTSNTSYVTEEYLLVRISHEDSNTREIRTTARMAESMHCDFTALIIETSDDNDLSEEEKKTVKKNMKLAEQLGGKVITVYGDDEARLMAEYAKTSSVSKIITSRRKNKKRFFFEKSFVEKLCKYAPRIEIVVIPSSEMTLKKNKFFKKIKSRFSWADTAKALGCLLVASVIGFIFVELDLGEINVIMAYILAVLFTAITTDGKIYSGITSIIAVFMFNYFFTSPRFVFELYNPGHALTFFVMLLTAFIISTLTERLQSQSRLASMKAYRMEILLETSQKLQRATDKNQMLKYIISQSSKLLNCSVVLYPVKEETLVEPLIINMEEVEEDTREYLSEKERAVAYWVYKNNKNAGATTNTLSEAKYLYLAIRSNETVYAVMGIFLEKRGELENFEKNLLLTMLAECGLALEKETTLEKNEEITMKIKRKINSKK